MYFNRSVLIPVPVHVDIPVPVPIKVPQIVKIPKLVHVNVPVPQPYPVQINVPQQYHSVPQKSDCCNHSADMVPSCLTLIFIFFKYVIY